MEQIEIDESGLKVSHLGIGTWQAAAEEWGEDVDKIKSRKAIIKAYNMGINFVDTAEVYGDGDSERVVGSALEEINREEMVIATKVASHLRYDDVKKACEKSLERLGIDRIDLYQVHWPDPWAQIPLKHTMRAMEDLYKKGKIKAVGVSNFAVRDLEEARDILSETDIVSNQVVYNMVQRQIEEEVLPYCRREGITVIAYSPLAQGLLTGKYTTENKPTDDVRKGSYLFEDKNLEEVSELISVMEDIAKSRDKTVAQAALNWLVAKPGVIPIPGAKNSQQAEWNAGAAGWELTDDEKRRINEVLDELELDTF
ncbi:hypothetical protein AKJ57_03250 [candidate division MSBL1 archaeon SCGC-AAA259A05]|uniref:NADP-dependent oxidoreductase domain-containing protein n=1 Tax=candidate division MSBL1 archaeon SCGC-AAA259A05 TaxID=1698259 RepID=A0A133U9S1_9EURY|nr:hypothetical protein AKJ57_03250 [candidate division MSBL1 archaeon SCGC-AAA259A05]